ncbi:LysE family transporter [Cytobacillus oceanisediminis]|uniref:LysE family transporter n=1 Tax=Cytobacillus oceanisediminis TaxID=665099 RepID=UPI0028D70525|nr:LysE family transporter [Cytobacillus oceanisediminis]
MVIGPVNSARLDKVIKIGFWHAWIVGTGSMIADAILILLIFLGLVNFLDMPLIQIFLWFFGGFVLIYSGIECLLKANDIHLAFSSGRESLFKCFLTGFNISISSAYQCIKALF